MIFGRIKNENIDNKQRVATWSPFFYGKVETKKAVAIATAFLFY